MIITALKGLIMADDAPTPEEMVPSFLHAFMWASAFGAVEEFRSNRLWSAGGLLAAAVTFHIVGIKWPQIKPKIGPRFVSILERLAGNRLYRLAIYFAIAITFLASIGTGIYRYYHRSITTEVPHLAQPAPSPISFRLGCEWDHIPIHIPAASTVHVIRLHPAVLSGNPNIQDLGVFEDITSSPDKSLDWPTKRNGRWMTDAEWNKATAYGTPNPWAFACTLTSYSSATLDEIVAQLLVDTPDKKRHSYPVAFDPLMSGHSFQFYVVNVCSSGVIPILVQWDDFATVRVLGESNVRRVPLRYEKKNWPSQLLGPFGPTSFVWNDLHDCQWDRPK
jgi:hypothetical protein